VCVCVEVVIFIAYAQSGARSVGGERYCDRQIFHGVLPPPHCPTRRALYFFFFSLLSWITRSTVSKLPLLWRFACFARAELSHLRHMFVHHTNNSATIAPQYAHLSPVIPKYVSSVPSALCVCTDCVRMHPQLLCSFSKPSMWVSGSGGFEAYETKFLIAHVRVAPRAWVRTRWGWRRNEPDGYWHGITRKGHKGYISYIL
jgi:hypothetical protein